MARPGGQMWTWTLCALWGWMCASQAASRLQYMVAIPAVLESDSETKFCASLLQPNETVVMTVRLVSREENSTLLQETSDKEFHKCVTFQAPLVENEAVKEFEVKVQGDTFYSREVRKVMIKRYHPVTFIQMDKPIYLPGQTVHFRVVALDTKLRPVSELYNIIEVEDTNGNRIGQWLNQTAAGKILQLSYDLNSEAQEGTYSVIVDVNGRKIYQRFQVEKYVLPKFDVTVTSSNEVSIDQQEIKAEVCAKYTYGQPVPGTVTLEACRALQYYIVNTYITENPEGPELKAPCYKETKQTEKSGCANFTFMMSVFTFLDKKALQDVLNVKAEMEEDGTGITLSKETNIQISYVIGRLSFSEVPKIYQPGSDVQGKIKAVYYNNTPIPDMPVYLFEGETWSSRRLQNLTTDSEGVASFSFSTAELKGNIHLQISSTPQLSYTGYRTPHYENADHTVSLAQNVSADIKTVSALEVQTRDTPLPCDAEEEIHIKYTIVGEAQGSVELLYLILSRGAIVMQGLKQFDVQDKSVTEGEVTFRLRVGPEVAPVVQVVAYAILPSETVIANSANFPIEKCFSHKVSLDFSPSSAVPGEEANMHMVAQPESLCGVSAVDQSVLIKEPGKTLKAEKIYNLLPITTSTYIPYGIRDSVECLHVRPRRYIVPYPEETDDAHTVFQNVGLKMATNLFIRAPSCLKFKGREYYHERRYGRPIAMAYDSVPMLQRGVAGPMGTAGILHSPPPPPPPPLIETVRTFFPETWIWELVEVGASGSKDVNVTVPDTITTWETEAFCLSPQGFGLAPRQKIKVFQPFFLELSLPYSIIRGEHFELKATVFNYLSKCIMVAVIPAPSLDYTLAPLSGDQYISCLCGNERKTLRWTMVPSALGVINVTVSAEAVASHVSCDNEVVSVPDRGRIDVVTQSLRVKAEGTEMMKTYNLLLCPKDEALTEEVDVQLPENTIEGSARATVSVLGDILGRALKNLDGLLRMPYGCGEQNMALLAPNIYILQYLKNTHQLTPAITEKASNFLSSGYQRQLNYKHSDGAYSTFGSGSGNTWLTAFVVRSFAKAKSFIYIDPAKIEESRFWLEQKQKESGCFEQSGKLFNNRMKGGVSDEVTLSAYITAAFLEMNISVNDSMVNKSLSCLRESTGNLSNIYTTALLAYVFTLAGDMETRAQLLSHLDTVALKKGGFLHWSQEAAESSSSLSVEISSYVLLAKLSSSPTAEDLGYATRIVRWLTGQQNYYGGFSSTQDTVVALHALALYSTLVFSPAGSSNVTVQSPNGPLVFDVNQDNKLLYQEQELKDGNGTYSVEVAGSACASVQVSLHYNIPTPTEATTLSLQVTPEADCNTTAQRPKLTLKLKSLYIGPESHTNMVILDIKMLSGFVPDTESLQNLKGALLVERVEQKDDHVLVYITELPKGIPINHSLELRQEFLVENLKPAVVEIYDYYQPSDRKETEYSCPCAEA